MDFIVCFRLENYLDFVTPTNQPLIPMNLSEEWLDGTLDKLPDYHESPTQATDEQQCPARYVSVSLSVGVDMFVIKMT